RVTASRPGAGRNGAPSCAQSSCSLRHVAHWFAPFRRPEVGPIPRVDPRTAGPLALRFMRPRHVAHWFAPFRRPEVGPIPRVDPRTAGPLALRFMRPRHVAHWFALLLRAGGWPHS